MSEDLHRNKEGIKFCIRNKGEGKLYTGNKVGNQMNLTQQLKWESKAVARLGRGLL